MANQCSFCEVRRIETNMMVLGSGDSTLWVEFCAACGERNVLTNEQGENWLVRELFDKINFRCAYFWQRRCVGAFERFLLVFQ